jgi:hypothetical protein
MTHYSLGLSSHFTTLEAITPHKIRINKSQVFGTELVHECLLNKFFIKYHVVRNNDESEQHSVRRDDIARES